MITRYKAADPLDPTSKAEYKVLAAGAQRYWHGTRAAFEQVKDSIPNNTMICITDDNGAPAYYARNPVWSQAVAITAEQINAGYSCPSDGIIVGTFAPNAYNYNEEPTILINNITVAKARSTNADVAPGSIQCQVNKNDIVKIGPNATVQAHCRSSIYFVPFEDSVTDPMIVTRDYIRNQSILSDYEDFSITKTNQTAQFDGIACLRIYGKMQRDTEIYVNDVLTLKMYFTDSDVNLSDGQTLILKKGDTYRYDGFGPHIDKSKVRWYKLRDYTGR